MDQDLILVQGLLTAAEARCQKELEDHQQALEEFRVSELRQEDDRRFAERRTQLLTKKLARLRQEREQMLAQELQALEHQKQNLRQEQQEYLDRASREVQRLEQERRDASLLRRAQRVLSTMTAGFL